MSTASCSTSRRVCRNWLIVLTLALSPPAQALQPMDAFLASARRNNPDNQQAAATARQRAALRDVATAALLPSLTAKGTQTRNQYKSTFTLAPGQTFTLTPLNTSDAVFTLSLPLFDFRAWEQRRAAQLDARAAEASSAQIEISIEMSVARAYYELLGSEALRSAALASLEYATRNAAIVRDRKEIGVANELDVQRALAEVARAQNDVASADQAVALARRTLESVSRLTPESATQADYVEDDLREEAPLSAWLGESSDDLVAVMPAVLAADAAAAERSAARGAWLPTIAANAQEHLTNAGGFAGRNEYYTLTATATWHVDFALAPDLRARTAALAAARATEDKARRAAEDLIYRGWYQVKTGIEKVRAARAQLRSATLAQDLARDRYEHGVATQIEVIQAQRDRFSAAVSAVEANADLQYARTLLRLAARRSHDGERTP